MEPDFDALKAEYIRKRADAIQYDAENCTSWRSEVERLICEVDDLDRATVEELREAIADFDENEATDSGGHPCE